MKRIIIAIAAIAASAAALAEPTLGSIPASTEIATASNIVAAVDRLAYAITNAPSASVTVPTGLDDAAALTWNWPNGIAVTVADGGTLSAANVSSWPEGAAVIVKVTSQGSYSVAAPIVLIGYSGWPTNTAFQGTCWRMGTNIYFNVISTL